MLNSVLYLSHFIMDSVSYANAMNFLFGINFVLIVFEGCFHCHDGPDRVCPNCLDKLRTLQPTNKSLFFSKN